MMRFKHYHAQKLTPTRLTRGAVVLAAAALAIGCSRSAAPRAACTNQPLDVTVALGVVYQSPSDSTLTAEFTWIPNCGVAKITVVGGLSGGTWTIAATTESGIRSGVSYGSTPGGTTTLSPPPPPRLYSNVPYTVLLYNVDGVALASKQFSP